MKVNILSSHTHCVNQISVITYNSVNIWSITIETYVAANLVLDVPEQSNLVYDSNFRTVIEM